MDGAKRDLTKRDLIWVGLLTLVSICLVSTGIWENGDVQVKWWAVKAWASFQFPNFAPDQHLLRWGVNFPAVAFVLLFGGGALSYLLFNHLAFVLATVGLYSLIRSLTTPLVAAAALFVWLINPLAYNVPSNFMPELFTLAYLTAALLLLGKAYATGSRLTYVAAMVVLFAAYGAKETNLFFMPGLGLYELLKRRWANVCIMIGVFAGGFLIETLAVNWLLGERLLLGRVEIILRGEHVESMTDTDTLHTADLFGRWLFTAPTNLDRLEYFSKALYWMFFIVSAWQGWRWLRARFKSSSALPAQAALSDANAAAWVMGLSFAFCTTFFILSLRPLVLGQPPLDRYLWPLVVPALVVLSVSLKDGLNQIAAAAPGGLSLVNRIRERLTPMFSGRAAPASLAAIAAFCTLIRWPIELGAIHIRRHGFDQAYTVFTAEHYYAQARERLRNGCTLVFSRIRPVQAFLVHGYPYRALQPPEQVLDIYQGSLDGLLVEGRRVRVWPLPRSDWPAIAGKLYVEPEHPGFRPYAVRLAEPAGQCHTAYYLGQSDINPSDQLIDGPIGAPPADASDMAE